MVELQTSRKITMNELHHVITLRGQLNGNSILGIAEAESLVFMGFQGQKDTETEMCTGYYVFREAKQSDEDKDSFNLSELPALEVKQPELSLGDNI